jgi:uncharacterized GH25 family protein
VLLAAACLAAHDTWLVPERFRVEPYQTVKVALNTSEDFPTSEAAPTPDRVARFAVVTRMTSAKHPEIALTSTVENTTEPATNYRVEGKSLVAEVLPGEGLTMVLAVTHPRLIVLKPEIFKEYLTEEGLADIVAARAARGQDKADGRERYSKITKLALCAAEEGGADFRQPLDLRVEIVPEDNPCVLHTGGTLRVRILFKGQPLAGKWVGAGYAGVHGHKYPVWVKTDAEGRATIPLDRPGGWFVRTLHMIPSTEFEDADWQSWFSTFTFEVR